MRQPGVLPESTAWSNHVHADHITTQITHLTRYALHIRQRINKRLILTYRVISLSLLLYIWYGVRFIL